MEGCFRAGRMGWRLLMAGLALCCGLLPALATGQDPTAPPSGDTPVVIRARVRVVPVRVVVTGPEGVPVQGLGSSDFRVLDNGKAAAVEFCRFEGEPSQREIPGTPEGVFPVSGRTFLFLLGLGGGQDPFHSAESLERFIRETLLPSDRLAVVLFDRVTEFTSDREAVLRLLARYRESRTFIETWAWQQARIRGLAWQSGGKPPVEIREAVDKVFAQPGVPASHPLQAPGAPSAASHDLQGLATGIRLLRDLGGEGARLLIFLTDQGITLPRVEYLRGLANLAVDSGVTLFPIQTGGVETGFRRSPLGNPLRSGPVVSRGPIVLSDQDILSAPAYLGRMAEWTGGVASVRSDPARALARVDQFSRASYLLGVLPEKAADGRYHELKVEVLRSGLTVHHRRGYYAKDE